MSAPRLEKGLDVMTVWERVCQNLGVDPVNADPAALKILGPKGYIGAAETTCQHCGLEMEGQFKRCIKCGGDFTMDRRIAPPADGGA